MKKDTENLDIKEEEITLSDDEMTDILENSDLEDVSLDTQNVDLPDDSQTLESESDKGDETIALSSNELDNILTDVDESQVLDLNEKDLQETEKEIVSVSGEELDQIAEDDKESRNIQESLDFEKEIMADAQKSTGREENRQTISEPSKLKPKKDQSKNSKKGDAAASLEPLSDTPVTSPRISKKKNLDSKKKNIEEVALFDLFSYLNNLLDHLPKEKIVEFAESKYYDKYIALINRLGIKE